MLLRPTIKTPYLGRDPRLATAALNKRLSESVFIYFFRKFDFFRTREYFGGVRQNYAAGVTPVHLRYAYGHVESAELTVSTTNPFRRAPGRVVEPPDAGPA